MLDQTTRHYGLGKLTKKPITVGNIPRDFGFTNVDLHLMVDHKVGDVQQSFRHESDY